MKCSDTLNQKYNYTFSYDFLSKTKRIKSIFTSFLFFLVTACTILAGNEKGMHIYQKEKKKKEKVHSLYSLYVIIP